MAQPFLDLGYIRLVIEGIGGGCGAQGVGADLEAKGKCVAAHEFMDAIGCDGVVEVTGAVVADGAEECALGVGRMASFVQVVVE